MYIYIYMCVSVRCIYVIIIDVMFGCFWGWHLWGNIGQPRSIWKKWKKSQPQGVGSDEWLRPTMKITMTKTGWWLPTPLKHISQLGWLFPTYGKIKHVPNHRSEKHARTVTMYTAKHILHFVSKSHEHVLSKPYETNMNKMTVFVLESFRSR